MGLGGSSERTSGQWRPHFEQHSRRALGGSVVSTTEECLQDQQVIRQGICRHWNGTGTASTAE